MNPLAALGLAGIFCGGTYKYKPVRRMVDIDDPDVKRWREFYDCLVNRGCIYDPAVGRIHTGCCPRRDGDPSPR